MKEIYLSNSNKEYYQKDFTQNVLTEKDNFWKLNDHIRDHLIELNNSRKVQTLYSKFPDFTKPPLLKESYLWIAYTKDLEIELLGITLPYFISEYNTTNGNKFSYSFISSNDHRQLPQGDSKYKMGYFINPDYLKINHLRFSFESYEKDKHVQFWKDLVLKLKHLK